MIVGSWTLMRAEAEISPPLLLALHTYRPCNTNQHSTPSKKGKLNKMFLYRLSAVIVQLELVHLWTFRGQLDGS